jgi:hypothetical protein
MIYHPIMNAWQQHLLVAADVKVLYGLWNSGLEWKWNCWQRPYTEVF